MDWTTDSVSTRTEKKYLSDKVDTLELSDEYKPVRMIGPSRKIAVHTFKIIGKKSGKEHRIPKMCLGFDSASGEFDRGPCPYCDIDPNTPRFEVLSNVIDRELQEGKPAKARPPSDKEKKVVTMYGHKCRIKEGKGSKSWTPVRMWRITPSSGGKISDLTALNKRKGKDGETQKFGPNHPKFGFDLNVRYDKNKSPTEQYGVLKDEKSVLEEEELRYLLWDLDVEQPEDLKTAKAEAKRLAEQLVDAKESSGGGDDDDAAPKRSKAKSKGGKPAKGAAEEDDWDEDEDFEGDDEDDEDEKPKRSKAKDKAKPTSDDDDDDDDVPWDEEDDEDEDERPKSKKSAKASKSKAKRPADDEDEDDDDEDDSSDDDLEDEDEDEKPRSKKSKVKPKAKAKGKRASDDDDDDDDSWDDDEDEEPAPKKKKKKRPVDEDEDEDDEARERPRKKKSTKKRRPDPEDDDDDDDDDWDD